MRMLSMSCILLSIATLAPAQTVIEVGPTRDYPGIQAAVDAIPTNGTILVDPGTYAPFHVTGSKSVRIHSADGSTYTVATTGVPAAYLNITGAADHCVITGLRTNWSPLSASIFIDQSVGTIYIAGGTGDDGMVGGLPVAMLNAATSAILRVNQSPRVYFEGVDVNPAPGLDYGYQRGAAVGIDALHIEQSTVVLNRCRLRGFDNFEGPGGHGVRSIMSTVWVDDTATEGGDGFLFGGHGILATGGAVDYWPAPPSWQGGAGSVGIGLPISSSGCLLQPAASPTIRIDTTPALSVPLGTEVTGAIDAGIPRTGAYTLWAGYAPYLDATSLAWTEGQPGLMDLTTFVVTPAQAPTPVALMSGALGVSSPYTIPFSLTIPSSPYLLGGILVLQVLHATTSPASLATWSEPQVLHFYN